MILSMVAYTHSGSSRDYFRHSPEEYHYIMRGNAAPDGWSSYSSTNRSRESENRRRQARGRASLGRPNSINSPRLVAPGPPNNQSIQRPHLQSITPNTLNSIPPTAPRRSITPGLIRQHSTGSVITAVTPPRSRLSTASSPSSEAASPPVAVGSGITAGDRPSPPGGPRSYRDWNHWTDAYGNYLTPNEHGQLLGRPLRGDLEQSRQAIPTQGRSPSSEYPQRHGDLNFTGSAQEILNRPQWSR